MSLDGGLVVSPQQVEQWILQSSDVSGFGGYQQQQQQRVAIQSLHEWTTSGSSTARLENGTLVRASPAATDVPTVLFQLLQQSIYPTVQFYALAALQRLILSGQQRAQLRTFLLFQFMALTSSNDLGKPKFLRNKAASVLAIYAIQDAATEAWMDVESDLMRLAATHPALFLQTMLYVLEDVVGVSAAADGSNLASHDGSGGASGGNSKSSTESASNNLTIHETRRFKHVLKGYHQTRLQQSDGNLTGAAAQTTTLLQHLFRAVNEILTASLALNDLSAPPLNSDCTLEASLSQKEELQVLSLQTTTAFFQWTTAVSFLGSASVAQCLECLLYTIQPVKGSRGNPTAAVAVCTASLQAWQEWITSSSDADSADDDGHPIVQPLATPRLSSSIQSPTDPKLPVLSRLLERIHQTSLLPESSTSKTLMGDVDSVEEVARIEDTNDADVVVQVAHVVNSIALELLPLYEQQALVMREAQIENGNLGSVETLFCQALDLFFRAFAHENSDVVSAVLPLASRLSYYVEESNETSTGPDSKAANSLLRQHLPSLLVTLFRQMKYPHDFPYEFDNEDDDDEEVIFRNELCKVYNKMVGSAPSTCLQFVVQAASSHLATASAAAAAPTSDMEAILRLIYHYCESIRPPPGLKVVIRNATFCALLEALHNSNIAHHPHPEVVCLYYETAVRYYPLFLQKEKTGLLATLLSVMSGTTGLQHEQSRVRSRCCYLLLRLTKATISLLRPFVETAVAGIHALLSNSNLALRSDDTLYLFETIGLLLGKTGLGIEDQQRYLAALISPHVQSMERILQSLPPLREETEKQIEILSGSVAAITHLSKGFAKPDGGVRVILIESLRATLAVVQALSWSESIRSKSMVLLQRMILCVGPDVLPMIPVFLQVLVADCSCDDILFVSQVFNQLCIKFNAGAIPAIDASLLPFLQKCQNLVPTTSFPPNNDNSTNSNSLVSPSFTTEQLSIQKLAYVVLQHVATYKATAVLISTLNAPHFEAVLGIVRDGAVRTVTDPVVRKTCIRFFREVVEQSCPPQSLSCSPSSALHDIGAFMMNDDYRHGLVLFVSQSLVPGVLAAMLHATFNAQDANQAAVIAEFGRLLSALQALCQHGRDERSTKFHQLLASALSSANGNAPPEALRALQQTNGSSTGTGMEACLHEVLRLCKA